MCRILAQIYTTAVSICKQVMYNKEIPQLVFKGRDDLQAMQYTTGQLEPLSLQMLITDFNATTHVNVVTD